MVLVVLAASAAIVIVLSVFLTSENAKSENSLTTNVPTTTEEFTTEESGSGESEDSEIHKEKIIERLKIGKPFLVIEDDVELHDLYSEGLMRVK